MTDVKNVHMTISDTCQGVFCLSSSSELPEINRINGILSFEISKISAQKLVAVHVALRCIERLYPGEIKHPLTMPYGGFMPKSKRHDSFQAVETVFHPNLLPSRFHQISDGTHSFPFSFSVLSDMPLSVRIPGLDITWQLEAHFQFESTSRYQRNIKVFRKDMVVTRKGNNTRENEDPLNRQFQTGDFYMRQPEAYYHNRVSNIEETIPSLESQEICMSQSQSDSIEMTRSPTRSSTLLSLHLASQRNPSTISTPIIRHTVETAGREFLLHISTPESCPIREKAYGFQLSIDEYESGLSSIVSVSASISQQAKFDLLDGLDCILEMGGLDDEERDMFREIPSRRILVTDRVKRRPKTHHTFNSVEKMNRYLDDDTVSLDSFKPSSLKKQRSFRKQMSFSSVTSPSHRWTMGFELQLKRNPKDSISVNEIEGQDTTMTRVYSQGWMGKTQKFIDSLKNPKSKFPPYKSKDCFRVGDYQVSGEGTSVLPQFACPHAYVTHTLHLEIVVSVPIASKSQKMFQFLESVAQTKDASHSSSSSLLSVFRTRDRYVQKKLSIQIPILIHL